MHEGVNFSSLGMLALCNHPCMNLDSSGSSDDLYYIAGTKHGAHGSRESRAEQHRVRRSGPEIILVPDGLWELAEKQQLVSVFSISAVMGGDQRGSQ